MNIFSHHARTFTLFIAGGLATVLFTCQSKPMNQQPSAQEHKKLEQEYRKAIEQPKHVRRQAFFPVNDN